MSALAISRQLSPDNARVADDTPTIMRPDLSVGPTISFSCGLCANDLNTHISVGRNLRIRGIYVGHNRVQAARLADSPIRHFTQLCMVNNSDVTSSSFNHSAAKFPFVLIERACSPLWIESIGADEQRVDQH